MAEWMKQAEANVETWKQRIGWYSKQDAETQTEQNQQHAWFAESAKKQEELSVICLKSVQFGFLLQKKNSEGIAFNSCGRTFFCAVGECVCRQAKTRKRKEIFARM